MNYYITSDTHLGHNKLIDYCSRPSNFSEKIIKNHDNIIKENEVDFLKGMDQIVFQYNKEADEKVAIFKKVEMSLLGIALITLLLEILFICHKFY